MPINRVIKSRLNTRDERLEAPQRNARKISYHFSAVLAVEALCVPSWNWLNFNIDSSTKRWQQMHSWSKWKTFCHEEAEYFTHLFWFCSKIELFWKHLIASPKDCNCLSDDYLLNNLVVLGLKPDTSKNTAISNFVLLLARFYIWLCKSKGNIPTIENFKLF